MDFFKLLRRGRERGVMNVVTLGLKKSNLSVCPFVLTKYIFHTKIKNYKCRNLGS